MKTKTTNDITSVTDSAILTMSSREIAELTEKQHAHVLRDIRVMLIGLYGDEQIEKLVPEKYRNRHSEFVRENADTILNAIIGDDPNWDHQSGRGFSWKRDNRGYIVSFSLDKTHTITLISGYNVKLRKRIVDRWQELEKKESNPIANLTRIDLIKLALHSEEERLMLEEKNKELTADSEALSRIAKSDGSLCITDAAKTLQIRPKDLFQWLRMNKWIYKRVGCAHDCGYQDKINQALLEHKSTTVLRSDGSDKITQQVRVTPEGLEKLSKLISADIKKVA